MKNCFLASLLTILLFSCEKTAIKINLDEFNGSHEKAFASQFRIKDGKVYLANASSAFDGKLSFIELDKSVRELTISDGEVEESVIHDSNKKLIAEGKREGSNFHINLKIKNYTSPYNNAEYALTNFSNATFIFKPLAEQEGNFTMKGDQGVEETGKTTINRRKNLVITETLTKDNGAVSRKVRSFIKNLPDSSKIEVTFEEDFEKTDDSEFPKDNRMIYNKYSESIKIGNLQSSLLMKTWWSTDGELRITSEFVDYKSKNCGESDVVVGVTSSLSSRESDCVTIGLNSINDLLKKKITREMLISRFMAKKIHKEYLSPQANDADFYF